MQQRLRLAEQVQVLVQWLRREQQGEGLVQALVDRHRPGCRGTETAASGGEADGRAVLVAVGTTVTRGTGQRAALGQIHPGWLLALRWPCRFVPPRAGVLQAQQRWRL